MGEEWRGIPGFEGFYQASNLGRVRRVTKTPPHIMTPTLDKDGYRVVTLSVRGKWRPWRVAMLVCGAFHGERPTPELQAAHDDGVRDNDVPENLSWKTPLEQGADKNRHGTTVMGEKQHLAKLTESAVREIRSRYTPETAADLAQEFGVTAANLVFVVKRQTWKHVI